MCNSKRFIATAKIAIHLFIALSYGSPHAFAGKSVLNDLNGVLPKWYLPF